LLFFGSNTMKVCHKADGFQKQENARHGEIRGKHNDHNGQTNTITWSWIWLRNTHPGTWLKLGQRVESLLDIDHVRKTCRLEDIRCIDACSGCRAACKMFDCEGGSANLSIVQNTSTTLEGRRSDDPLTSNGVERIAGWEVDLRFGWSAPARHGVFFGPQW
jgi:hypothetical protein